MRICFFGQGGAEGRKASDGPDGLKKKNGAVEECLATAPGKKMEDFKLPVF